MAVRVPRSGAPLSGMTLDEPSARDDASLVDSLPFWLAAVGGVLLAVSSVKSLPTAVWAVGAALFVLGVALFFMVAARRSRADGVALTRALGEGARDALRFAWHLMP
jgi:hypothetical protein